MKSTHAILLGSLLFSSCGADESPLTELVLVADSDLTLDRIVFEISSAELGSRGADASRSGPSEPSYLSLVHEHGPLGPVTVSARGLHNGSVVVQRTQLVFFVENQTRVVPLHLLASCVGVVCSAGQTCAEAGCIDQLLDDSALPVWQGLPPRAPPTTPHDAGGSHEDAGNLDGGARPMEAGTDDAGLREDSGSADAALDAAVDGAVDLTDGGFRDAGPRDAGPRDGGPRDAATDARVGDAAVNLTQCAAPPAPPVDLSSDVTHCGSCTKVCKPSENCLTGTCVKK